MEEIYDKEFIDKFESNISEITENGCKEWLNSINRHGYGYFYFKGGMFSAHRTAYEIKEGKIPDGKFICHSCDNRKCVNSAHLWIGTQRENMNDMKDKKRAGPKTMRIDDIDRDKLRSALINIRESIPLSWCEIAKELDMSYLCIKRFVDDTNYFPSALTVRKIKGLINKYKEVQ